MIGNSAMGQILPRPCRSTLRSGMTEGTIGEDVIAFGAIPYRTQGSNAGFMLDVGFMMLLYPHETYTGSV